AWSLATEEQFYLFWPPLLALVLWSTRRLWPAAAAALTLLCIQWAAAHAGGAAFVFTMLASLAPAILMGVVFAVVLHHRRAFELLFPVLGHRFAASGVALLLVISLGLNAPDVMTRLLMAVLVATVCVREDTALHPFLAWRP